MEDSVLDRPAPDFANSGAMIVALLETEHLLFEVTIAFLAISQTSAPLYRAEQPPEYIICHWRGHACKKTQGLRASALNTFVLGPQIKKFNERSEWKGWTSRKET